MPGDVKMFDLKRMLHFKSKTRGDWWIHPDEVISFYEVSNDYSSGVTINTTTPGDSGSDFVEGLTAQQFEDEMNRALEEIVKAKAEGLAAMLEEQRNNQRLFQMNDLIPDTSN